MNIIDLFAHIGLKADTKQGNDFLGVVNNIQSGLVKTSVKALSFAVAIKTINDAFSDTLALKRFEQNTGLATERLQQWRYVAEQVSGSAETVNASIEAIATNQEKIKFGQGSIKGYQLLGIDPNSDPFEVLEQLRQKMQGLPAEMKRNIAQEFGVSRELVATLELTNDQFAQMSKTAFVVPQESIDRINKFRADVDVMRNRLDYLKNEIVAKISPAITDFLDKIIKWTTNNQSKIISGLKTLYLISRDVEQLFSHFATVFDSMIKSTIGWGNALKSVIVGLGLAMISTPFGSFVAGFMAIMLVIDDLYTYVSGKGKSVFGEIVDKFPAVGKAFSWLTELVTGLNTLLSSIFTSDSSKFDAFIKKWEDLGGAFKSMAQAITSIRDFFSIEKGPKEYMPEEFMFADEDYGGKALGTSTEKMKPPSMEGAKKAVSNAWKWIKDTWERGQYDNMGIKDMAASTATTGNYTVNNNTSVNADIQVTGVTDPVRAGDATAGALKKEIDNTKNSMSRTKKEK